MVNTQTAWIVKVNIHVYAFFVNYTIISYWFKNVNDNACWIVDHIFIITLLNVIWISGCAVNIWHEIS